MPRHIVKSDANPAWLAFNRDRTHLYAANEVATPATGSGTVSAYAVDRATGQLTLLNSVSSEGAGPAHLSIHPAGKHALVANYGGGLGRGAADSSRTAGSRPRLMSSGTRARPDRHSRRALHPEALPSADTIGRTRT